jgi:hypothetical protein
MIRLWDFASWFTVLLPDQALIICFGAKQNNFKAHTYVSPEN